MNKHTYIYLIHIFIVAPLFIYTGHLGNKLSTGSNKGYKKYFNLNWNTCNPLPFVSFN